jgi:hypothetical protein
LHPAFRGNVLDLLLTNVPERISDLQDAGRLGRSDHCILSFEMSLKAKIACKSTVKNWGRADWPSIRAGLVNTRWPTTDDATSVEEHRTQLKDRINVLTDQHVPARTITPRRTDWMSTEILQLIRKKRRLWKKAKYGQATDEYEATSRDLKNKIRASKRKMEKKLATVDSRNKKPFYNYVKNKTKTCESVGPLKTPDGHLVTDSRAMANMLNNSFSTVFTREDYANVPRATPLKTRTKSSRNHSSPPRK